MRQLILNTAKEMGIDRLEETLKWGEPSYLCKNGSTLRLDWKKKKPDQFALYFKCTSLIVPSIRKIFKDQLNYENQRAIVIGLDEEIPQSTLIACIQFSLNYHVLKKQKLLGYHKL